MLHWAVKLVGRGPSTSLGRKVGSKRYITTTGHVGPLSLERSSRATVDGPKKNLYALALLQFTVSSLSASVHEYLIFFLSIAVFEKSYILYRMTNM